MRKCNNFLYILRNGNTQEYKIGITKDLNRRISELQTGCPHELVIIKIWQHYQRKFIEQYERVLHRYYKQYRIRKNGEWFKLPKSEIEKLCKPETITEQNNFIENIIRKVDK